MELINNNQVPEGYKKTEVGVIPEDWDVLPLGEITSFIGSGKSIVKSRLGDYPLYGSTGIITYSQKFEYQGDAILVARVGANAGKLNCVSGQYGVSDNTIIIKLKDNSNIHFFLYQLRHKNLNSLVFGSGQPLITGTQIKNLNVINPKASEQKAIAQTLSDVDALIDALDKLITKKRNIKTATMQQLLTGKTRLLGFRGEWEIKKIEDIARPVSVKNVENEKLPVLTCSKHLGFVDSLAYFKNQIFSKNTTGYKVICFGEIGYPSNHIEEGSIGIQNLYDKALVSPIYTIFSVNQEIDSHFLHKVLKLDYYRQKFKTLTTSSVDRRGSLRWPEFSQITVSLPPLPEQKAITQVLSDIDTEITALEKRRAKTQAIKQGMMQELLTGRTRLINN
jgi:type I restriction enzyme S subunit